MLDADYISVKLEEQKKVRVSWSRAGLKYDVMVGGRAVLIGREEKKRHRDTQRKGHVRIGAEKQVMILRTKMDRGLSAAPRSWERGWDSLSPGASRRNQPCPHLDLGRLVSRMDR